MPPARTQPDTCTIPGCTRPGHARSLCNRHYQRGRANGDPATPSHTEKRAAHADEVVFLISCRTSVEEALARLTPPWTPAAAHRWAYRHHRPDLAAAIAPALSARKEFAHAR